jgi:hypothetical protein
MSDTSISSSFESVLVIGNDILRLISSCVANYGSFPFSSVILQLIHILFQENFLSHVVKLRYSFFNSLLKPLMFFEKCNCSQISHSFLGMSWIYFTYSCHACFFFTSIC